MKEPEHRDYYRTLGIPCSATSAQIKKAYHAAAKKHHPDKATTPSKTLCSTTDFQELLTAYETLSDAAARKSYNARYPNIKALWDEYDRKVKVQQAKRQKRARFTQEFVVIRGGHDEFKVHGHMLQARSHFFRTELEKAARGEAVISFPGEDDVVAAYVECVYHGVVQTDLSLAVLEAQEEGDEVAIKNAEFAFLAQLYVFGEKIQDASFCNAVITSFATTIDKRDATGTRSFPNSKVVTAIYDGTSADSPARQMLVDLYAENAGKHWFPACGYGHYHVEFTYDLLRDILVHKTQLAPQGTVEERCETWFKTEG